jgi:hypothetical protein
VCQSLSEWMETTPSMQSEELTLTPLISSEELQVTWAMGKLVGGKSKNSLKLIGGVGRNSSDVSEELKVTPLMYIGGVLINFAEKRLVLKEFF